MLLILTFSVLSSYPRSFLVLYDNGETIADLKLCFRPEAMINDVVVS
jgi:hypothetical protein